MDRRHFKETLSTCLFKISHLDDNRKDLDQIDQTNNQDDPGHAEHIGRACHKTAQSQRSGISHKYLCRMHIKQQKAQKCSCHSCCHRLNAASENQRSDRKEDSYHSRHTGSQTIQTIGKIHAVDNRQNHDKQQPFR